MASASLPGSAEIPPGHRSRGFVRAARATVVVLAAAKTAATHGGDVRVPLAPLESGTYWNESIMWGLVLIAVLVLVAFVVHMQARNRRRQAIHQRRHASALKYMADHGVGEAEVAAASRYFFTRPDLDPESAVMSAQVFAKTLGPNLSETFGAALTDVIHDLLFSRNSLLANPSDSRRGTAHGKKKNETEASIPFVHPGNPLRVIREGGAGEGFTDVILSTGNDYLVVATPDHQRPRVGEEVEVHIDVGLALCGLVAQVTEVTRARPYACQIGRFVEAWVIRRRKSMRLQLARAIKFSCMPLEHTQHMESLDDIEERLTPVLDGHLRDISFGGCGIITYEKQAFHKGDLIRFSVDLVAGCPPAMLFGTVVHVAVRTRENNSVFLGIQFLALDGQSNEILARALRQLMTVSPVATAQNDA